MTPLGSFLPQAGIAGVPSVTLLSPFPAAEFHFVDIRDNDAVTGIDVRGVSRPVLAHEYHGNVAGQPPDNLVRGIDNVPLLFDFAWLGHVGRLRDHGIDLRVDWCEMCTRGNREIYRGLLD